MIAPLKRRVMLMVSRGVVSLVNDGLKLQGLQVELLAGEVADDVERFQEYGFTSVPASGAEVIALAVGGNRSHLVVIACDDRRYRPGGMVAGEVAVYAKFGSKIVLKASGDVEITPASGKVKVTGDVEASVDLKDAIGTIQAMRDAYNGHKHEESGGGTTLIPDTPMI